MFKHFMYTLAVVVLLLTTGIASAQTILRVDIDNDIPFNQQDGATWNTAYRFLQDALAEANANATEQNPYELWVAEGTYRPDQRAFNGANAPCPPYGSCNQNALFWIEADIAIRGGFAGTESTIDERPDDILQHRTILDGDLEQDDVVQFVPDPNSADFDLQLQNYEDNSRRVVLVSATNNALLDRVTIRGAFGGEDGGSGLRVHDQLANVGVIVRDSIITENHGSLCVPSGIAGCHVPDFPGGGVGLGFANSVIIINTEITRNISSGPGGGIHSFRSGDVDSLTLVNVTLTHNVSEGGDGGAMYFLNGSVEDGTLRMWNCLVARNKAIDPQATASGGGLYVTGPIAVEIINTTIAENIADAAGGMYIDLTDFEATIFNSIIRDNSGDQITDAGSVPFTVEFSNIEGGWTGTGNIDDDPLFNDPPSGDYRLFFGSPSITAGNRDLLPDDEYDLDENSCTEQPIPFDHAFMQRVQLGEVDQGYREHIPCPGDLNGDGIVDVDDLLDLLAAWGDCPPAPSGCPPVPEFDDCYQDLDGTGAIGIDDLLIVLAEWGVCDPSLPEPISFNEARDEAGISQAKWDEYLDVLEFGTQQEIDCWNCWAKSRFWDCSGRPQSECPDCSFCADPFIE